MAGVTAKYRVVADQIRGDIQAGKLRPGQELPSYRAIAEAHDVLLNVVASALKLLEAQGWVRAEHGRGTFVVDELPSTAPALDQLAAEVAELRRRFEEHEQRHR